MMRAFFSFEYQRQEKTKKKKHRRKRKAPKEDDAPYYILELIHSSLDLKQAQSLDKETKRFIAYSYFGDTPKAKVAEVGECSRGIYLDSRIQKRNKVQESDR